MSSLYPTVVWDSYGRSFHEQEQAADAVCAVLDWDDINADGTVDVSSSVLSRAVERLGGDWSYRALASVLANVTFAVRRSA